MMTLKTIPDFHPRSPKAAEGKGKNVLDPDRLTVTPSEWAVMMKSATVTQSRVAVRASSEGPGLLTISKTEFEDGRFTIVPVFTPNNLTAKERELGKVFTAGTSAKGWPYATGLEAIAGIRGAFNMKFKEAKFNEQGKP